MSPPYREFHDDDMGKPPSCQYYAQVRRIMISLRSAKTGAATANPIKISLPKEY